MTADPLLARLRELAEKIPVADSGRVEEHDRCYRTAQAIDECAAALRAVGKGEKR